MDFPPHPRNPYENCLDETYHSGSFTNPAAKQLKRWRRAVMMIRVCSRAFPFFAKTQASMDESLPYYRMKKKADEESCDNPFYWKSTTLPGEDEASTSSGQPLSLRTLQMHEFPEEEEEHCQCPHCKSPDTWISYQSSQYLPQSHHFCESWTRGGPLLMLQRREFHAQQHSQCPRCKSTHTWICYHSSSSHHLSWSRHFCDSCQNYWYGEFSNPSITALAMGGFQPKIDQYLESNSGSRIIRISDQYQGGTRPLEHSNGAQLINNSMDPSNEVQYRAWEAQLINIELETPNGRGTSTYPIRGATASSQYPLQSNDSPTQKMKLAMPFLAIAGQVAASFMTTLAKDKWPFIFAVAAIAIGFICGLSAIFLHPRKKKAAAILEKIGVIIAACAIIVTLCTLILPENIIWVSFFACLIPCIALALIVMKP
ncbi:uncharacterized protein LOC132294720 [Cornus florida]|uniref:uncharacterized protein LOC132294720 n=1 Tax=Cornus florida TaxID=4283 RepID=UPI002896B4CA|nr:uncharacterized protein LOC132294720 [Cornus florida]